MSDFTNRSGFNTDVGNVGLEDVHEVRLRGLATTTTATASRGQVDLFVQASQVAENLRAQVAELERRERNLNEQLSQFDREQRSLRLRALNAEEEARLRAEQLAQQEQQFSERFQQTEQLLAELKLRERELTQANQTLEQQRATLKQQLEKQNEVDKAAMQHSQAMADSERKQLSGERERLAREQQAILEAVQGEIEQEKARLRKEYAWELDGEIEHFRNQREAWTQQQAQDREQLADDKRVHEDALRKLQADWAEQRRQQQNDLDGTRRQLEQQRQQLHREHDEALRRLQLNWQAERQQLRIQWAADLDEEKQKFAEERAAFEAARDSDRAVAQSDANRTMPTSKNRWPICNPSASSWKRTSASSGKTTRSSCGRMSSISNSRRPIGNVSEPLNGRGSVTCSATWNWLSRRSLGLGKRGSPRSRSALRISTDVIPSWLVFGNSSTRRSSRSLARLKLCNVGSRIARKRSPPSVNNSNVSERSLNNGAPANSFHSNSRRNNARSKWKNSKLDDSGSR